MLGVAASEIARVSQLEADARRQVEELSPPRIRLGQLYAVALCKTAHRLRDLGCYSPSVGHV